MYAIISDIHSNLPALEAVLADIESRAPERIVCLGDVVGYGPDPAPCLTLVRDRCAFVLKGNHDIAVLLEPFGFNRPARDAAIWTKTQVEPKWYSFGATRANWDMLKQAPERIEEGETLFVHASPRDPVMEYIEEGDTADAGFGPSEKIQEIFSLINGPCFVGHTHRPGVIEASYQFRKPGDFDNRWLFAHSKKAVINVGSVGQPRDGDPRACYVTVDDEGVTYHRVEYDVQKTVDRIHAVPELDDRLGDRLPEGR